jgi:hypothetical protein
MHCRAVGRGSTALRISGCVTGTPDKRVVSPVPVRSSSIVVCISPMTSRKRLLATTSKANASTISVNCPSSDNNLPRMTTLFSTGSRAENNEMMPLVAFNQLKVGDQISTCSINLRASRLLPSTTMRTSNSFDGRRRVTSSTVLNSGVSDRSRLGLRPATYSAPACPYQAAGHAADGCRRRVSNQDRSTSGCPARSPVALRSHDEIALEPVARQTRHFIQRSRFFKQMCRCRHDRQLLFAAQLRESGPI